jgi:hypothetical protein
MEEAKRAARAVGLGLLLGVVLAAAARGRV